ncbi:hypothetical protein BN2475_80084 [Paraburkholderia ribeironis]|uniref:Uncharacterized protein n=1 Tax=Paraburkholderia ribeironis TaxID=1247936 RepID=A0A1N7RMF2_9BURK|nr:hypothetical protein BN2475_80084 [Paraburkholderia ribeironis]
MCCRRARRIETTNSTCANMFELLRNVGATPRWASVRFIITAEAFHHAFSSAFGLLAADAF